MVTLTRKQFKVIKQFMHTCGIIKNTPSEDQEECYLNLYLETKNLLGKFLCTECKLIKEPTLPFVDFYSITMIDENEHTQHFLLREGETSAMIVTETDFSSRVEFVFIKD